MSDSDQTPEEIHVEQALLDYLRRRDEGQLIGRDEFLDQHPEMREQLLELLEAADWIETLAGPQVQDEEQVCEEGVDNRAAEAHANDQRPQAASRDPGSGFEVAENGATRPADEVSGGGSNDETLPHKAHLEAEMEATWEVGGKVSQRMEVTAQLPEDEQQPKQTHESQKLSFTAGGLPCQFGEYILERQLGRGGMGVVYYGKQIQLERPVAIKMIRSGALASDEEVQRFYAEARSAAQLDHQNIVTVYQCGEQDGHHYFSMDYIAGQDLARFSAAGPIDGHRAAKYVRDAARAIHYAHQRGVLHRDLKPANILIDEADRVHITDFGLAKLVGHDTGLTASGAALGTPSYMAPEQAAGRTAEHRHTTDVYSLGAILFTLVTGRPPFKGGSVVQTIMQVIHRPAPRARTVNPQVHPDIETIIDRCLQKSPDRRYATAEDLAIDLDRFLNGLPIDARPMSPVLRAWYWLLGVPIVGAVLDHRVVEPTEAHRWVQRGLISAGCLMLMAWALFIIPSVLGFDQRMPREVRIAAGEVGGSYDLLARTLADAMGEVTDSSIARLTTAGSNDNLERLLKGQADLALLQADTVGSAPVSVVAPLFYEAVHIFVRRDADIMQLEDLVGKTLAINSTKSGSYSVTRLLLERAEVGLDEIVVKTMDWRNLRKEPSVDAAIVVNKPGTDALRDLLASGHYELMAFRDSWEFALEEPAFHALLITDSTYPDCDIPRAGIPTVATTAFMAAKPDAPSALIEAVLDRLFATETVEQTGILSAEQAAHWQGLAWHPTARAFFEPYR